MQFQTDNMACGGSVESVTRAIHSVAPQAKVDIDLNLKCVPWIRVLIKVPLQPGSRTPGFRHAPRQKVLPAVGEDDGRHALMANGLEL